MELFTGSLHEILPTVLVLVPSKQVLALRCVCSAWCRKIDSLPDSFWKKLFATELWREWISVSSYFTLSLEEFDIMKSPIPALALKEDLSKLTPLQRVRFMQRPLLFASRRVVQLHFFRDNLTSKCESKWTYTRTADGRLEWRDEALGPDEPSSSFVMSREQETNLERGLFGLQHHFKPPFVSTWKVKVTATDMETGKQIFCNDHIYGHFLDDSVGCEINQEEMLTRLPKMEVHCRETFISEVQFPEWMK